MLLWNHLSPWTCRGIVIVRVCLGAAYIRPKPSLSFTWSFPWVQEKTQAFKHLSPGKWCSSSTENGRKQIKEFKSALLGQEQVLQNAWQHCRARLHERKVFTFPFSVAALCLLHFSALASPFDKWVTEGLPWESEHWKTVQLLCCWTRISFCSQIKTGMFWRKQGLIQGRFL